MADAPHTVTTLDAFYKEVYADNISKLIPDHEMLMKNVPFVKNSQKNGGSYNQPVILTRDHGISFLGDDSTQTLLDAVPAVQKNASVKGAGKVMKTQISNMAVSRAVQGPRAFVDGVGYAIRSLTESFANKQEASHWYGDNGFGYATAATADLASDFLEFAAEDWAPALWIGAEGMPVDIYSVTGALTDLGRTTNALVVDGTTISKVDMINRRLYFASVSGMSDGNVYAVCAKDQVGYDSTGILEILANSGSLFGISAATYPLWQANQYSVGSAALNFAKVSDAVSIGMGRGVRGPLKGVVHSTVFRQLFPDFLTLKDTAPTATNSRNASRRFNSAADVQNVVHGTDGVSFTINGIKVVFESSEYLIPRQACLLDMATLARVGSSEIRAGSPSVSDDGRAFFEIESKAVTEFRMFSDQGLFCEAPSRNIIMHGISLS